MKNKILSLGVCLFLVVGNIVSVYGETSIPACKEDKVVIAFFNGVGNSEDDAKRSAQFLRQFYGDKTPSGVEIEYDLMYNSTLNLPEDILETFIQKYKGETDNPESLAKLAEIMLARRELYLSIVNMNMPWYLELHKQLNAAPELMDFLEAFREYYLIRLREAVNRSPTAQNHQEHINKINEWNIEGKNMLFVAHSQGNLFANAAYEYQKSIGKKDSVRVVHVAPPTYSLGGRDHALVDQDFIIRNPFVPDTPDVTDYIPVHIPFVRERPAGANGLTDWKGHGFVEIYINKHLEPHRNIKTYMNNALNELAPFEIVYDFDINNWLNQWNYYVYREDEYGHIISADHTTCTPNFIYYSKQKFELAQSISYSCYAGKQKYTQKYYILKYYIEVGNEANGVIAGIKNTWYLAYLFQNFLLFTHDYCEWNNVSGYSEHIYDGECSSPPPLDWALVDQMVKYGMPKACSEACVGK